MNYQLDFTGVGASYRRVSDDAQDLGRQRAEIERFLTRNGISIDTKFVFEDLGWKRHQAALRKARSAETNSHSAKACPK